MRHPHADLIITWAEGTEIQWYNENIEAWVGVQTPSWHPHEHYRINPKEPEWYKDIPKHGVLCWVSEVRSNPNSGDYLRIITTRKLYRFVDPVGTEWAYATPLTNDEIRQFLRGEQ